MKKLKLLILGGSNCQRNAFIRARKMGIETVLFDYLDSPPAACLADFHIKASTFDPEACLKAARGLGLDGVMTLGTDQPVYTAALIARELGLPSLIDVETAVRATNKQAMKTALDSRGVPVAAWFCADRRGLRESGVSGPVVIKPLDGQGQKGVFYAENAETAAGWVDETLSFSRLDRVICEEYYPSNEVTVSGWVSGGEVRVLTVTDRLCGLEGRSVGVCRGHRFPSLYAAGREEEVRTLTEMTAAALGVKDGPLYVQLLIGGKGVIVNEAACRIGGAFEDVFIPRLTGFDILGNVISAALGMNAPGELNADASHAFVQFVFCGKRVIPALPEIDSVMGIPGCLDAGFNFQSGDAPPPFENSGARAGYAVFAADSQESMARALTGYWDLLGPDFY